MSRPYYFSGGVSNHVTSQVHSVSNLTDRSFTTDVSPFGVLDVRNRYYEYKGLAFFFLVAMEVHCIRPAIDWL